MSLPRISNPASLLSRCRDLTLLDLLPGGDQYLVVACDSDGGIGSKPHDAVKASEELAGTFAVRVPLFEVIACGAEPFLVVDCLSVEMAGAGERIIAAIKSYAARAGIVRPEQFTGSTEDNVPTVQTGIGVTVLGLADKARFSPGTSERGDAVLCAGVPKSAPRHRLALDDPEVLSIEDLIALRASPHVRDVLPVGSKGVLREAGELARSASLRFVPADGHGLDPEQSAGPSTCVLLSVSPEGVGEVSDLVSAPVGDIGTLI